MKIEEQELKNIKKKLEEKHEQKLKTRKDHR